MVPIKGKWTPFAGLKDQIEHFRLWGLIPERSTKLRPIMVTDGYWGIPEPCKVVGYQTQNWAVIELADGYHAIHGNYLAELQPVSHQRLPRGICFAEVLQKYVVIDIETTGFDFHHDRIIEIAAAIYEYGNKVDYFQSLVNPEMLLPDDIIALTGITQEDVANAPTLNSIAPDFLSFIEGLPIVGHNALTFDVPFLSAQISQLENLVIDTLPMARKVFDLLPMHKLEYLKNTLGLNSSVSHRALSDVETTNDLLWACLAPRRYERQVVSAFLDARTAAKPSRPVIKKQRKLSTKGTFERVDIKSIAPTADIDKTGPLFGKSIVFTGSLSLSREDAMQMAVNAGATLKTAVSRKTNYLVVGKQDKSLVGEDGKSTKEETADLLNQSGKADIKVITEKEFIALINKEEVLV